MGDLIHDAVVDAERSLAAVAEVDPLFMTPAAKGQTLSLLARMEAETAELKFRILIGSADLAAESGARDIAAWSTTHLHQRREDAAAELRLAQALTVLPCLTAGLREGRVNVAQAKTVVRAIRRLPATLAPEVLARAEAHMVDLCTDHDPQHLHILGKHLLRVVAPELDEIEEGRRLAEEERTARDKSRLSLKSRGDGTCSLNARLPDTAGAMLASFLNAFTNPRVHDRWDRPTQDPLINLAPDLDARWDIKIPYPRRAAEAFCALLEAVDPTRLPIHGGDAATIMVTIDLDTLRSNLGVATLNSDLPGDSNDTISASEARRMACNAQIIPVVLGSTSEVLDLGRSQRLFSRAQRRALLLRDKTCRAEGCTMPGRWCEAHHWVPWRQGGRTDLNDAVLFCTHDHHLAHDDNYEAIRLDNGDIRFHRRQ